MNKILKFLNDLNGWKLVITIIFMSGVSYAGIINKLETNRQEFKEFAARQEKKDDKQDEAMKDLTGAVNHQLERLSDKVDELGRSRTKQN